jgi:hypothetical protein
MSYRGVPIGRLVSKVEMQWGTGQSLVLASMTSALFSKVKGDSVQGAGSIAGGTWQRCIQAAGNVHRINSRWRKQSQRFEVAIPRTVGTRFEEHILVWLHNVVCVSTDAVDGEKQDTRGFCIG